MGKKGGGKSSKSGGGGGKGGGGGPAAKKGAAAKCTCDHPYQCSCGNRPERPSRGHKWDPEEQKWGGKGHKQKGGSIQAAAVGKEATTTKVGKTTVAQWQRLPNQLLDEFCKREGRPRPKYKSIGGKGDGGHYKFRVIVQDAKASRRGGDHDIILVPGKGCGNEEQAKEEAALLALLHLTPSLPHERKLPEPYKTTWTNAAKSRKEGGGSGGGKTLAAEPDGKRKAAAAKKKAASGGGGDDDRKLPAKPSAGASSSSATASASDNLSHSLPYATAAERRKLSDARRREKAARIARHEAVRSANRDHSVFMSAAVRRRIERLLRGDFAGEGGGGGGKISFAEFDEEAEANDDEEEDEVKSYVVRRLVHEGFGPGQARGAYAQEMGGSSSKGGGDRDIDEQFDDAYERCLQWLCVHLDEEDLPEGFDPRGRTLDVMVAGKAKRVDAAAAKKKKENSGWGGGASAAVDNNGGSGGGPSLSDEEAALVDGYGVPPREARALVKSSSKSSREAHDVLWEALCSAAGAPGLFAETTTSASGNGNDSMGEVASEEMEALEAIFPPEECSVTKDAARRTTAVSIVIPSEDGSPGRMTLEVHLKDGMYPDARPVALIKGGWKGTKSSKTGSGAARGTAVQIELVKFLSELTPGEPVIYELYGHAQTLLLQQSDGEGAVRDAVTLLPHLGEDGAAEMERADDEGARQKQKQPQQPQDMSKKGAVEEPRGKKRDNVFNGGGVASQAQTPNNIKRRRRPRERSAFWSKRPSQSPPAEAFPQIPPDMEKARRNLPAHKARSEFLSLMSAASKTGRVVLVTGETGCGKTTQIPQFILEDDPSGSKIVVAQPRRLAAAGVAARVADERGEGAPGKGSVGYVVRGDVAMSSNPRLVFCTTGVLLRQLQSERALECVSHIVVDEVHERNLDTDVLLGVLKECLPSNPHLKVVLMSATMDANRFAAYWGKNTPRMHIPGFTYPVEDYTLEDVLEVTGYVPPKKGKKKKRWGGGRGGGAGRGGGRKQSPWADSEKSDDDDDEEEEEDDPASDAKSSASSRSGAGPRDHGIPVEDLVARVNESDIDYDMLAVLVRHLLQTKTRDDDGSILVFLPGAPEISRAEEAVKRVTRSSDSTNCMILPLHGGLQPKDQGLVFRRSPRGCTKIILSTNVAETSITIPDCTVVVDTCREKQSSYDPTNRMPLLVERFASRDSLRQRRGRAGRVRSGRCYKLISRRTHDGLPPHGTPEIRRCALDQTLLSLLFLGVENARGNFLGSMLDPPSEESINAAVHSLEKLGAVSSSGFGMAGAVKEDRRLALTPLGMHLAGIPAPPCVGKLLIMGSLLGCRKAALAIAAGMSVGRSPFLKVDVFRNNRNRDENEESPEEMRQKRVIEERAALFKSVGGNSDLAMLAAAYMKWDSVPPGGGGKKKICDSLGLSFNGMRDMKSLVRQLDSSLKNVGYYDTPESESNSGSWRVIRSCVVSALSPGQLVRVERPSTKYADTVEGAVEKDGNARELKFFIRGDDREAGDDPSKASSSNGGNSGGGFNRLNRRYHGVPEERVFVHPSSSNFGTGNFACPWLVYHQLVRTSKPFLRDATECSSYALLLFGGPLDVRASDELIVVDGWARLSANARIGALVGGLRRKVDELLSMKVADPSVDIAGSVEMKIIVSLLKSDGLGQ